MAYIDLECLGKREFKSLMQSRKNYQEVLRYILAGTFNSIIGYSLIIIFEEIVQLSPQISNLFGYIIGICCSFLLNKNFVFNKKFNRKGNIFSKFIICCITAYSINFLLLNVLLYMALESFIGQGLSMICYSIVFYFICKFYVFKSN